MPIDPDRLLAWPIAPVREVLAARDAAFYALSVGLGQDPTDARQLRFVDPAHGPVPLPWMALVLGQPGFWYDDPGTGIDALRLVHGEQELELHRPLAIGAALTGRTRVTGLVDRGPRRGALLTTEKRLEDASGGLVALARATLVLRGDGGFGGADGPVRPPAPPPHGEPDLAIDLPTRPEQALLYRLNGDDNPLHADPATAARAGFDRPILHGLCTLGVVAHALLRGLAGYDPARLRALRLRFSAPVFPGETIRTEIWRDGGFRARALGRDALVIDNGHATVG